MKWLKAALFPLISLVAILGYNNCAGNSFEPLHVVTNASSTSSQCRAKIMSSSKSFLQKDAALCESPDNYHCDLRHFRPHRSSGQSQSLQCVNVAGLGEACVTVTVYDYDTSTQWASAEANERAEGGAYNRDEATCINTRITSQQVALIQTEADSTETAFEKAIEQCRQRTSL